MLHSYAHAAEELAWRYLRADSELGVKGQAVGGSVHVSFDTAAASRMHDARIRDSHREALARRDRVDGFVRSLRWDHQLTIRHAFEPYGRASRTLSAIFTTTTSVPRFDGTPRGASIVLVGLAIDGGVALTPLERDGRDRTGVGSVEILEELEAHCPKTRNDNDVWLLRTRKPAGILGTIFDACVGRLASAVAAYDELRAAHHSQKRQRQEALLASEVSALHTRLWGAP